MSTENRPSHLQMMVHAYEKLLKTGRCYCITNKGNILLEMLPPGEEPKIKIYSAEQFSPDKFYGVNSLVEMYRVMKSVGLQIDKIR